MDREFELEELNELIQRYVDGDLSGAELRAFESELQTSEELQAEVAAFRTFKAALFDSRLDVAVPRERLEALIPKSKAPVVSPRSPWIRWAFVPMLMVLMVGGYLRFSYDPMNFAKGSPVSVRAGLTPAAAASWVAKETGIAAPALDCGTSCCLVKGECGSDWAAYTYESDGKEYRLYMKQGTEAIDNAKLPGEEVHDVIMKSGKGIGWAHCGMSFYLTGGNAADRRRIAEMILVKLCAVTHGHK